MPKVRLSALVSDMKGKSNGSVFSKNSGGVYFRNNPSGGGKKSAKWDKQKGNLAQLSRSWKSLDADQQDAWNAAVSDYQTLNVWGETRIPSGYELFMRLNGVLLAIGKPLLSVPTAPRSIVSVGAAEISAPDLYQFTPQRVIDTSFTPATSGKAYMIGSWNDVEQDNLTNFTYSMRLNMLFKLSPTLGTSTQYGIFQIGDLSKSYIACACSRPVDGVVTFAVSRSDGTNTQSYSADVPVTELQGDFDFAVTYDSRSLGILRFYINGKMYNTGKGGTAPAINDTITGNIVLGCLDNSVRFWGTFSDFRYFETALTHDEIINVSFGYVLGNEVAMAPMTSFVPSVALSGDDGDCNDDEECAYGYMCIDNTCQQVTTGDTYLHLSGGGTVTLSLKGIPSGSKVLKAYSPGFVPRLTLSVENSNLSGTMLNVYASPPLSYGRNGNTKNLKLIGSFVYDENVEFDIAAAYRNTFANLPSGSTFTAVVSVVDLTTGVATTPAQAPPRKRPRFKAGAELSGAVN